MSEAADATYAKALGQRLRAVRVAQGLTLQGVEQRSNGKWKGVVVGSYERASRAVSVQRLAELADFYGVPVSELLPDSATSSSPPEATPRLVIDLDRLQDLPASEAAPLARYTANLQSQRGDEDAQVMTIRYEDLRALAIIYDATPAKLAERMESWGVLNPDDRREIDLT